MSLTKKLSAFLFLTQLLIPISDIAHAEDIFSTEESIDTGEGEGAVIEQNTIEDQKDSKASANSDKSDEDDLKAYNTAKVIAVNKITAQSKEVILKVGEAKYFGNIEIKVHKCYKDLNPYNPDNKILLTIVEEKVDEEPATLFQGWMMSSNISISTFEHPVYKIFAKDCFK